MTASCKTLLVAVAVVAVVLTAEARFAATVKKSATASCHDHPWPYERNTLNPGQSLSPGEALETSTSMLVLDTDGNLALSKKDSARTILWETKTGGSGANKLLFTTQGILELLAGTKTVWSSGTTQTNGTILVLQDDCNLVIYQKAPLTGAVWNTNTQKCLRVHIVPHSHDDVGWLLSPERYFDGCRTPGGGISGILTTVVEALTANPNRTFIEVEMYYFQRWWVNQTDDVKKKTRTLVTRQQLQFINAGWSMHDEACVHQENAISNMEAGAQFLRREFGETFNITIGWHIDPFGHASATPRLMAQMGFNAFFFWRTDYQHKNLMLKEKTLETMWYSSPSLGDDVLLFSSIMPNGYCMGCQDTASSGFVMCPSQFNNMNCEQLEPPTDPEERQAWEATRREMGWERRKNAHIESFFDAAIRQHQGMTRIADVMSNFHVNGEKGKKLTLQTMASDYVQWIKEYAGSYRTNNVLIPWGCDFRHQNANEDYLLMDLVIDEINKNDAYGMQLLYSTPQHYMDDIARLNYSWPVNHHDYFLDSDDGHSYWSGYFTSRAEYKGYERVLLNERFSTEMLLSSVAGDITPNNISMLEKELARVDVLRQALGVSQHHDCITGTERVHVRNKYQFILARGEGETDLIWEDLLQEHYGGPISVCHLANLSVCTATSPLAEGHNVTVIVFNQLLRARTDEYISIPVPTEHVEPVLDNMPLEYQVVTTWDLTTTADTHSPMPQPHQPYELIIRLPFIKSEIGHGSFTLVPKARSGSTPARTPAFASAVPVPRVPGTLTLRQDGAGYSIDFDTQTGMPVSITNEATQLKSPFNFNVYSYCPHNRTSTGGSTQASGAYIFRTCSPNELPVPMTPYALKFETASGSLCMEVRQWLSYRSNVHQRFRVCKDMNYVEITSGIGEVDPGATGVEIILKTGVNVSSKGAWYLDSQGLETDQRIRNARPNYPYTVTEPIASNYFPSNAFAYLRDETNPNPRSQVYFGLIHDRGRATASLKDGELEFLVQRRLLFDDSRGVGEPLNESTRVLTTSRLLFVSSHDDMLSKVRYNALLHLHPLILRFASPKSSATLLPRPSIFKSQRPRAGMLPAPIHLHTRTVLAAGTMMIRLQHLFAVDEGPGAIDYQVDLSQVMPDGAKIAQVVETDMNGITPLAELKRQSYACCDVTGVSKTCSGWPSGETKMERGIVQRDGSYIVTMRPMDIRTFLVAYETG